MRNAVSSHATGSYLVLQGVHDEPGPSSPDYTRKVNAMRFLRIRQVMQLTGLSRMTIYRLELAGAFPKRRRLAENSVAWLESDIEAWADSRPVQALRGTLRSAAASRRPGS
jgi:prophage regulatory protein